MTEDEKIAITKEHIRHFILARKLKINTLQSEAVEWIENHWNLSDDAQRDEYYMLFKQVEREMQDER